jgi:uncharacterized phage protein (TIGR01671 family)
LNDKKGKEIYEGDIFQYTQHGRYNMGSFKAEVCYDNSFTGFGYKNKEGFVIPFSEHDELDYDVLPYLEVIGNIYENHE